MPIQNNLFPRFEKFIRNADVSDLEAEVKKPDRLIVDTAAHRGKRIDVVYAPFDHVTAGARIVIVGITPGRQQMRNALLELHKHLCSGRTSIEALAAAKVFASFSGPMRSNLVNMLDHFGVHRLLGLGSTGALWGDAAGLAHFTSALRHPVFADGANYSGQPSMLQSPLLRAHLREAIGCVIVGKMGIMAVLQLF